MNTGKKLVMLYTRINGVEKLEVAGLPANNADIEQIARNVKKRLLGLNHQCVNNVDQYTDLDSSCGV